MLQSLLLVDSGADAIKIQWALQRAVDVPNVVAVATLAQAVKRVRSSPICCIVTEVTLPDANDRLILQALRHAGPRIPIIVLTAHGSEDTARMAFKAGVADYVRKQDGCTRELLVAVREVLGRSVVASAQTEPEVHDAIGGAPATLVDGQMLLTTMASRPLLTSTERAARSNVPVLIEGETGTGKELIARLIHRRSPRRGSPFVVQNCAALTESLLEAELFGHLRGSFTGAEHDRRGLFVEAADGTVFLDEIGEAPLSAQAKLLRVLQHSEVKPVGADRTARIRARVVTATNRRLEDEVVAGRFRADLYYRLAVFPIQVPPLRHRVGDIVPLAKHFLARYQSEENRELDGFTASSLLALQVYPWPGNVRELEHEVHRLVLTLPQSRRIQLHDLSPRIRAAAEVAPREPLRHIVRHVELAVIRQRLREHPTKASAARSLGLTREALYEKLRKLEADPRA